MNQYIGIDLHKAKSFVTLLDGRGRVLEQVELVHASGELQEYLARLPAEARIAVEATGNWMWLYELIEARHPDLVLAHPLKTKAIASARIKTDKIDATTLAQLLRADLVPAAYIPPRDVRDTREVLRYRASLVRLRVQGKKRGRESLFTRSSNQTNETDQIDQMNETPAPRCEMSFGIVFCLDSSGPFGSMADFQTIAAGILEKDGIVARPFMVSGPFDIPSSRPDNDFSQPVDLAGTVCREGDPAFVGRMP